MLQESACFTGLPSSSVIWSCRADSATVAQSQNSLRIQSTLNAQLVLLLLWHNVMGVVGAAADETEFDQLKVV